MDRFGVQKDFSNAFSNRCTSGFAGDGERHIFQLEIFRQQTDLCRLPAAFDSFKTDEASACHPAMAPSREGAIFETSAPSSVAFMVSARSSRASDFSMSSSRARVSGCFGTKSEQQS